MARLVTSQLNCQIILLPKRPLTHYWSSPLKHCESVMIITQLTRVKAMESEMYA